ncbi:ketoacyl-synthetase C-terminal extension domain-containing protein [Streptomyces avermitilis]|uniref:ketoacyl-synthetase C-terminal extension domain-containing protein n=1 Tax=Streptomyces avermitilis TaxID=33903 RepID=UPI00380C28F1
MGRQSGGPGPLTPAPEGQLRAMRRAYADARATPSSVGFLEAHGTGTRAGDRAEAQALRRLRTEYPDDDPALCYLGSAKALIGHSLSAAGIAGLIKTALVHHRTIVPQPDTTPHPDLGIDAAGLRFAPAARPWPGSGGPLRAAVSSFGFGGTNVHVVLTPPPAPLGHAIGSAEVRPLRRTEPRPEFRPGHRPEPHLVLISAGSPRLLEGHIGELLDFLDSSPGTPPAAMAHTLGGREMLTARLAVVAATPDELTGRLRRARRQLADGVRGDLGDGAFAADAPLPPEQRRIAFAFPGQGSQRPAMMHDLYQRFGRPWTRWAPRPASTPASLPPRCCTESGRSPPPGDAQLRQRPAGTDVCDTGPSHDTPITPCIVGDSVKTLQLAEALFKQGISVNPIPYPAVPEKAARLRFFITCDHTPDQIHHTVRELAHGLRQADTAPAA